MKLKSLQLKKLIFETISNYVENKCDSFNELTEKDLYHIAKWGLENEFCYSGAWDETDDIDVAISIVINEFKKQLNTPYPEGFKKIPNKPTIYRIINLDNSKDLNKNNLGYSWFTNPNRIESSDFRQQLEYLKGGKQYVIKARTNQSNIDIPRTLFKRDSNYLENEIVVIDDSSSKIELLDIRKIHQ